MTTQHLTILTGASRGLGSAMAAQLLKPDAHLLCISRSSQPTLTELAQAKGATLEQWRMDLADATSVAQALRDWLTAFGPQHFASATLINNAGVISALVPLRQSESSDLAHALRVGLEAPMLLCSAFLGATASWLGQRKVLNISSGLGRRPMASSAAYCAAKAGMDLMTRCIALEEAALPNGAQVCSLAPGVVDTDMQVQLRGADPAQFPDLGAFDALYRQGHLTDAHQGARRVLDYLARHDFGSEAIADVRS